MHGSTHATVVSPSCSRLPAGMRWEVRPVQRCKSYRWFRSFNRESTGSGFHLHQSVVFVFTSLLTIEMLLFSSVLSLRECLLPCAQETACDPGIAGPPIETIHYYYDEWLTGTAISLTGRLLSSYLPGLDPMNENLYRSIAELTSNTTETPYPSAEHNSPSGGRYNYSTYPPASASSPDHLVGVQRVVIGARDHLWIRDTGRAALENGTLLTSSFGGPKLVGVDLSTDSIITMILFPTHRGISGFLSHQRPLRPAPIFNPFSPGGGIHHRLLQ